MGGSKFFFELVKLVNLSFFFEDNGIVFVVKDIKIWLDFIDDSDF